ncbi:MAG: hypothetical protein A3F84_25270 [Candidatus Handelsmanbacteria bacterium RIFCSPLOWO2_12_FULL_64_10]|uniref:TonB-dependent receptor plug domain-containing protein n=1 Tax=Handelsmanbacteria sp. (strain RIFCSPLOWO2_12_FULL_64_10) TaxID=1817868 RepID=A0A1F6CVS5_HANXR|nr:MAG: hypothetical protein A3F84_25270 [Candidatus Handelsmanbacteria bacterium RIFCSPLOWO2_12_FULL_64_10]
MKRKLLFGFVALGLILVYVGAAMAGTTGKLNGVVKDQKGAPLPGATVLIEGTKQGAVADANGYYVIINVSPGTYRLAASLIGYDKVTKSTVGVIADQTTTQDFALKETAVQMAEVTVIAERPLVEPDKTTSKYTVTREQTEQLLSAARNTQDLLTLQPGVAVDGSNRIRGGNTNYAYGEDISYVVDGIRMNYNDGRGYAGRTRSVNRGAIQELSVLTGVTPAEFGNAQGGVVQIITKDGENKVHGWGEFRYQPASKQHWGANVYDAPELQGRTKWNDNKWLNERWPSLNVNDPTVQALAGELIHQRTDYTKQNGWEGEANLSGPIGDKASFVATLKHSRLPGVYPGPEMMGFRDDNSNFVAAASDNIQGSGSLTFKPSQNVKVKLGGMYQWWKVWNDGNTGIGVSGLARVGGIVGVVRGTGQNLFLPEHWSAAGRQVFKEELQYVAITHTVSPRTFYEVRLSRSRSQLDTMDADRATSLNNLDQSQWFNIGRTATRWSKTDRQRYGVRVDISSQVSKGHFMKGGVELDYRSIWMLSLVNDSPDNRGLLVLGNNNQIEKPAHPFFINAYAQDKMEFQGMIVNLGVRMDAFNPNARTFSSGTFRGAPMFRTYTRARDWAYQDGSIWTVDSPWHVNFSPRVGVSHPITSRSQIRFSSGVFLQFADLWYYLGEEYYSVSQGKDNDFNNNGRIDEAEKFNAMRTAYSGQVGSPLVRPAKTTAFEVGMDWNFVSDYTAALTAYYKSEVEQFTWYPNESWQGAADLNIAYSRVLDNGMHGDTRGVELSLRKNFSHYFSFSVSYNYQWAMWTTGKLGNVVRYGGMMDSLNLAKMAKTISFTDAATGAQVPQYWVEFTIDPATGREVPKLMDDAAIKKYGEIAQRGWNSYLRSYGKMEENRREIFGSGISDGLKKAEGPAGEAGVYIMSAGYTTNFPSPKSGDRRNFGSMSFLMSLPDNFKFGPAFVGNLLSNTRMTLITRLETGGIFGYNPPQGGTSYYRSVPMDSRTDLALEKVFHSKGRVQPTVFVDIRNLFNQQDRYSPTNASDWTYYGIQGPRPDDQNYQKYGDARDRTYTPGPRQVQIGLRMNW